MCRFWKRADASNSPKHRSYRIAQASSSEPKVSPERYRFDHCELHPAERRLLVDGRAAVLGGRAFDVLMALVERRGRVVTKGELIDAVWPDVVVEENNLPVQISLLRKALGSGVIATVAGRGYQFTAELQPLAAAPPAPAALGSGTPPASTSRLVGREAELAALTALLQAHRLVTLAGPGGIGKTRLALGWCEGRPGRIVWVELASLADASLLPAALLGALGIAPSETPHAAALRAALAGESLTIVLDNAEPLAADVALLARSLLADAPRLSLLVTSQVPLRLPAEQVLRLGTLSLPEGRVTPEQALQHGAVQLFVERVRAADPAFELVPGNVSSVVEICTRLDGLPLALELAAARVPVLGVTTLAAALDERLRVIGDPQRSAPARQRTLAAALEWSHGLLDLRAQRVFRRLGVFAGGFTLGAAQAVVGDDDPQQALDAWAVMATIGRLVEDSLVTRDGRDPPRFGLLESTRLFALERLALSGEAAAVRRRHLAWCAGFVEATLAGTAPDETSTAALTLEYPNLRAALERALGPEAEAEDRNAGAALAAALVPYWDRLDAADASGERRRWLPGAAAAPAAAKAGDTAARLLERLQADGVAAAGGVDPQTVIALARRLRGADVKTFDGALKEIERAVDIAGRVLAGSADGSDAANEAFVGDALSGVAEQARRGRLDEASEAVDEALAELERREARRQEALKRARRALLEAGVQQDLLRGDAFAAARRIEAIAALDAPQAPTRSALYLERERQAFAEGEQQAVGLSLQVAIELMRRRCAAAVDAGERRAATMKLAEALLIQGRRGSGDAELVEALALLRAALADGEGPADELERAALLHLLARALQDQGQRSGGVAPLEEAARHGQAALALRPRARDPQAWAESQHLLGTVLWQLGSRDAGNERLVAAAAALREALKERTRSRAPLLWARSQNGLGIVLSQLARREGNVARRHEAAEAFRNALLETPRETHAMEWAGAQNNLGIELAAIGEHEGSLDTLQASVDAYRAALREWTRERLPSHWASVQHNLGGALRLLGEREPGTQSLREAVLAFGETLKARPRDSAPLFWAATKNDLGLALLALGRRESGTEALLQAVRAFDEALLERRRDNAEADWASTQLDRAQALLALGERTRDAATLAAAATACDAALEVLTSDLTPEFHAQALQVREQARRGVAS
jgi:predicted ATPase/DNA-binding winged helix-turn-helix (wHTH) protein